jgi:ABC-type dipeptide transport system, periplasmic component
MKKVFLWSLAVIMVITMVAAFSLSGCNTTTTTETTAAAAETTAAAAETTAAAAETTAAAAVPLNFSYNPDTAKKILADAGYKDVDGDGFVEAPDGSKIALTVTCPLGWSDWMEAIRVISESAQAAGINLKNETPDYGAFTTALFGGTFDTSLYNPGNLANTPWTVYNAWFNHPVVETMQNGNYGRYNNQELFDLVDQLGKVSTDDVAGIQAVVSKIQKIQLTDLPYIPLWYNGVWAQFSNAVWTNWSTSAEGTPKDIPCTWNEYWQRGGLMQLTELKPVEGVEPGTGTYPRNETLYVSGAAWGAYSDSNPLIPGSKANSSGTIGLLYETPFMYDPLTDKMIPWLAESGSWTDPNTYEMKIRQGIQWSDGQPLTAEDVKFTYELGKNFPSVWFSPMWKYMTEIVKVDDYTLQIKFTDPIYQEFSYNLFNLPIVPEHIWKNRTEVEVSTGINENPVGSGAYLWDAKGMGPDRNVWVKNPNWWAIKALGLNVAPKRIVDIRTSGNNVTLGMILKGEIDLSNNFLPGVAELINKGYVQSYYPKAPYMLSANTACLFLNLTKKPLDDPAFRKALAFSINTGDIVNVAYANLVQVANPTGLLPSLDKYIDKTLLGQ